MFKPLTGDDSGNVVGILNLSWMQNYNLAFVATLRSTEVTQLNMFEEIFYLRRFLCATYQVPPSSG